MEVKLFKNAFDDGFFSLTFLSIHSLSKLELKLTLIDYGQRQPSFSVVYDSFVRLINERLPPSKHTWKQPSMRSLRQRVPQANKVNKIMQYP